MQKPKRPAEELVEMIRDGSPKKGLISGCIPIPELAGALPSAPIKTPKAHS